MAEKVLVGSAGLVGRGLAAGEAGAGVEGRTDGRSKGLLETLLMDTGYLLVAKGPSWKPCGSDTPTPPTVAKKFSALTARPEAAGVDPISKVRPKAPNQAIQVYANLPVTARRPAPLPTAGVGLCRCGEEASWTSSQVDSSSMNGDAT